MNHKGTVILKTDRLILRPFTADDAELMYQNWASDPEVTKFLTWPAHQSVDVTRSVLADWIAAYDSPKQYAWAIELRQIHEPIGSIAAVDLDDRIPSACIGYCIGRNWWGQSIVPEALRAVIAFFMEEVGMYVVCAYHDPNNPNSGKVMKKCGMSYEGTWRAVDVNHQGICDKTRYSILKSEYINKIDRKLFL